MEVLRLDFKSTEAMDTGNRSSGSTSMDEAPVWSRLFRHFTLQAPLTNRLLIQDDANTAGVLLIMYGRVLSLQPKVKAGRLMLEVGVLPEWQHFEVALAGSSIADLGLYYYANKSDAAPIGFILLHSAHIDVLEEVLMVVTTEKTWFLCAEHGREASDWAEAICGTIEKLSQGVLLQGISSKRRRLSSNVSVVTLKEIQSREPRTRVDEFLEVFVKSNCEDIRIQAMKGALSWSCMRNLAWKLWLDYLPLDVPFNQWLSTTREKRQKYTRLHTSHRLFKSSLSGAESDEDFITACETSEDNLVYDIYKDVRRTRGAMPFFRKASVQCMLIRILYTYSHAHPEISYNQGMGELVATILYLLYIEQWPASSSSGSSDKSTTTDVDSSISPSSSFEKLSEESDSDDASYVYVESFINLQSDDTCLDGATFLKLAPFAGHGSGRYSECCREAAEEIVREMTSGAFLEHDAYLLLEEMMFRMAGAYCPEAPPPRKSPERMNDSTSRMTRAALSSYVFNSGETTSTTSPLYDQMNSIHNHILSRCDPPLARHLSRLGIEPQMFSLRWVRVLMSREFAMAQVWQVWDAIFSLTPCDFSFINLLCVAAVREFRDEILAVEDATSVLLCFRDISDRVEADRLVDNARDLYEALMIAVAAEASTRYS